MALELKSEAPVQTQQPYRLLLEVSLSISNPAQTLGLQGTKITKLVHPYPGTPEEGSLL